MSTEPISEENKRLQKRLAESESSHWYDQDGNGCHEIQKKTGKPGEMRAVNKTDALKMDLVPSVTNLLSRYKNRSGIEKWSRSMIYEMIAKDEVRLREMLLHLEQGKGASFDKCCQEIDAEAEAQAKEAAHLGSVFHYFIEEAIKKWSGRDFSETDAKSLLKKIVPDISDSSASSFFWVFSEIARDELRFIPRSNSSNVQEFALAWNIALTTASRGDHVTMPFGIGGKFDLITTLHYGCESYDNIIRLVRNAANLQPTESSFNDLLSKLEGMKSKSKPINVLVDWKTRKPIIRKTSSKISYPSYPSDAAQLAAYSHGASRSLRRVHVACNYFIASDAISISSEEFKPPREANTEVRIYSPDELESGLRYMNAAAAMWVAEEEAGVADAARKGKVKQIFVPVIEDE